MNNGIFITSFRVIAGKLLLPVLLTGTLNAYADVAVIVNPGNNDTLDKDAISAIYLGKEKSFPSGNKAIPLDLENGASERVEFLTKVLDKNEGQYRVYWSRKTFSGKGVPPQVVNSASAVKEMVSRNPDAIGFINASAVDDSVKVVATF